MADKKKAPTGTLLRIGAVAAVVLAVAKLAGAPFAWWWVAVPFGAAIMLPAGGVIVVFLATYLVALAVLAVGGQEGLKRFQAWVDPDTKSDKR